jgi:hypothetical protein
LGKTTVHQGLQYRLPKLVLSKTVKTKKNWSFFVQNLIFKIWGKTEQFSDLSVSFSGLSIDFSLGFYLKFKFWMKNGKLVGFQVYRSIFPVYWSIFLVFICFKISQIFKIFKSSQSVSSEPTKPIPVGFYRFSQKSDGFHRYCNPCRPLRKQINVLSIIIG